jgi:predicted ATPase
VPDNGRARRGIVGKGPSVPVGAPVELSHLCAVRAYDLGIRPRHYVGRDEELDLLLRCWRQATTGGGRVVLVSGEAGIGKSRLSAALSRRIQGDPHIRLRYFCSPHHQDSALYPVIAQLERAAGLAPDDTVEEKLGKLRALLVRGARDENEIALLAERP